MHRTRISCPTSGAFTFTSVHNCLSHEQLDSECRSASYSCIILLIWELLTVSTDLHCLLACLESTHFSACRQAGEQHQRPRARHNGFNLHSIGHHVSVSVAAVLAAGRSSITMAGSTCMGHRCCQPQWPYWHHSSSKQCLKCMPLAKL
jgi:hypothetical protein